MSFEKNLQHLIILINNSNLKKIRFCIVFCYKKNFYYKNKTQKISIGTYLKNAYRRKDF